MTTVIRGDDNFDTADNATQTELDNGLSGKLDSTADVGKVLQVAFSDFRTNYNHNSTSYQDTGHSITITPLSSSSTLHIEWAGNISTNMGVNGMGVAIREGTTTIQGGTANDVSMFYYNDTYTNNTHINQSFVVKTPSTGTTSRTFKVSTKITHGSPTGDGCKYQGDWGPCVLRIFEVA